jgi:hypothetical protein
MAFSKGFRTRSALTFRLTALRQEGLGYLRLWPGQHPIPLGVRVWRSVALSPWGGKVLAFDGWVSESDVRKEVGAAPSEALGVMEEGCAGVLRRAPPT